VDKFFRAGRNRLQACFSLESTLARLEATLDLVDNVNPALAADQAVVAVTTTQ
jgi:hypothetical protein